MSAENLEIAEHFSGTIITTPPGRQNRPKNSENIEAELISTHSEPRSSGTNTTERLNRSPQPKITTHGPHT